VEPGLEFFECGQARTLAFDGAMELAVRGTGMVHGSTCGHGEELTAVTEADHEHGFGDDKEQSNMFTVLAL